MNLLEIAKKVIKDDFLVVRDYKGKKIIFYKKNYMVYILKCESGYEIKLANVVNYMCFKHIPIVWQKIRLLAQNFLLTIK